MQTADAAVRQQRNGITTYRKLIVWQKAVELVLAVYELTEQFPREELYGLTAQMRASAVSIPSNVAEGRRRGTRREFARFLRMAYGSGAELETQIEIAKRLQKTIDLDYSRVDSLLEEVMRMLNTMIRRLHPSTQAQPS